MISFEKFSYEPNESECEKASNSYLMSLVALMAGFFLPIINLAATVIFFFGNRKSAQFVRWHCTQALMSQLMVFIINAFAVSWTLYNLFGKGDFTNEYFGYLITVFLFNLIEFIGTIIAAINTRKGVHVKWWVFGPLTNEFFNIPND